MAAESTKGKEVLEIAMAAAPPEEGDLVGRKEDSSSAPVKTYAKMPSRNASSKYDFVKVGRLASSPLLSVSFSFFTEEMRNEERPIWNCSSSFLIVVWIFRVLVCGRLVARLKCGLEIMRIITMFFLDFCSVEC